MVKGLLSNVSYHYDAANRLQNYFGTDASFYTYDANGNLLSEDQTTYVYDSANRLMEVSRPSYPDAPTSVVTTYAYNGLGDRLSQTLDGVPTNYTLDLNTGLTQVLSDGTNTYTYGLGRISQTSIVNQQSEIAYFLGDALGSVRQLTNNNGEIILAKSYDPYGNVAASTGSQVSMYGYSGEQTDSSGMVYLRARYYNSSNGRFQSRDTFSGNANSPMSMNRWNYVEGNPINYTDPSGKKVYDDTEDTSLNNVRGGVNYLQDTQETYFTLDPQSSNKDADVYTAEAGPRAPVTILDYIVAAAECAAYLEQFEWWREFTRWGAGYGPDARSIVNYYRFATGIRTDDLRGIAISHVAIYGYTKTDDIFIRTKVSDKYGIYAYEKSSPSIPESLTSNVDRSSHSYYYDPEILIPETPEDRFSITIEVNFSVQYGPLSYKGKTVHEISP